MYIIYVVNELLVNLVNSVLGVGKRTARGNQSYHCPFCNHHKPKLEVNFSENKKGYNPWHCWVCDKKGTRISTLFKQLKAPKEKFDELGKLIKNESEFKEVTQHKNLKLPKEFKTLIGDNSLIARQALAYLKNRGITQEDIIKYNMGYCENGIYANKIIIPSYDENSNLNFFIGRSFEKDPYLKYKHPQVSTDIIPFELFINWELPIIICEGPFDAIAIKRNAIPLLGKNIQPNLMKKIISSLVQKIYIALDSDALKKSLQFTEQFLNEGKEVYLVELDKKDPSEMGFSNFTKLIQKTLPLTQFDLMEKKLSLL